MVLIADGGSTKCDWILLNKSGDVIDKTRTAGLNPTVVPQAGMVQKIEENETLQAIFKKAETVDFYGAGCGTKTPRLLLQEVLEKLFVNAKVTVKEDLAAAVYAATTNPGIVAILGTGSNCCYFDGHEIHTEAPALGYALMDDASGNYYGKQLLRDYYYKKMPPKVASEFEEKYDLDPDTVKVNLYKKPNPTAYLGSFSEFLFLCKHDEAYFNTLIKTGVALFIKNQVLIYKEAQQVPIHFVGSIAFFTKKLISDCLKEHGLQPGNFVKRPIDGLIAYYKKEKL
ncbi:BadF/BadG/BcrA/BcrD ATPase family protein [Marixanthomonas spongiae]|uniref:N-acetylglucosamine kinase n=1 Tax=Marixanthomonas spongiae TaxID=2174845 RepID=A0A2U0I3M0_9FLAO|nr:BadF/BadG/BcrA/BcrD ATPase family protein [Marixanthomonas spongiae]PVW15715.1 N-acetylglucosamine kinase [Marixanthomonas spongiae]